MIVTGPVRIPLAPIQTLGRLFQYAALSILRTNWRGHVFLDQTGSAAIVTSEGFKIILSTALDIIENYYSTPENKSREKCEGPVLSFKLGNTRREIDCCKLISGPKLYSFGLKKDSDNILRAGLDSCYTIRRSGKKEEKRITWTGAALSYIYKKLTKQPLKNVADDIPTLAKSSIFSRIKLPVGSREQTKFKAHIDTLGTILLGGIISFLGRLGDHEYYLLPVSPAPGYLTVVESLSILAGKTRPYIIASELPIPLELSQSFELTLEASKKAITLGVLWHAVSQVRVLVLNIKGRRPQLVGSMPLTIIPPNLISARTLSYALQLAYIATGRVNKHIVRKLGGIKDTASECLRAIYHHSTDPCGGEHLLECIQDLVRTARSKGAREAEIDGLLKGFVQSLNYDYGRSLKYCIMGGEAR